MPEPDQRTELGRRDQGEDPAQDVREEYTSYRKTQRGDDAQRGGDVDQDEASREADLQPGPAKERDED